jgi:hypothetical protein
VRNSNGKSNQQKSQISLHEQGNIERVWGKVGAAARKDFLERRVDT